MRHVIANLKTKLEARTPLVDNDIKTDKPRGEELMNAIACKHVATYPMIYRPIYAAILDITRYIYLVFVLASTNKVID